MTDHDAPNGDRATASERGTGPFARLRSVVLVVGLYAAAVVVWIAFGRRLPGGRWFPVHLFTLGIVTNLVLALSDHFARTLTHQGGQRSTWQLVLTNAGVVALLWGVPNGADWVVACGAALLVFAVMHSYVVLRRLRKTAIGARFDWVVRTYERAHGAFVHGAILGGLLGTGVLGGGWPISARIAHLHVNVLGWAGLTLLSTLVFFGPTVVRRRIEPGADARAARALPWGATGLTAAVLALFATGVGGSAAVAFRLVAAGGLAVYAWCVVRVCLPVVRAALRSQLSAGRPPVVMAPSWFVLVALADVVVVATGEWRFLDALGVAMLAGVLFQTIAAAVGYLAPLLQADDRSARDALRARIDRHGAIRAVASNAGVALVAIAAVAGSNLGDAGPWLTRTGWGLMLVSAAALAAPILLPHRARTPASSSVETGYPGTEGDPMSMARTDDGASIAYHTQGTGPRNLVFLHAWGASGSYFDETIESLDLTAVRAISLDLRGHGDSDKPDTDLTWERLARDVFAVGDAVGADAFVAVGHSMGGKLAQYLPLVDPSRVEALVLVASPSAGELPLPSFAAEWIGLAGDAQAFIDTTVSPYLRRPVPEHVLRRLGENAAKIPRGYLERTLNLVSSTSFIERLGSVRVPTLVVSSARDPLHSTERDIVASLPNARLEILDCGPEIPMELPAELADLIEKFVAELP